MYREVMGDGKSKEKSLDYGRFICCRDGHKFLFSKFYNSINEEIAYWDNRIFNKVTVISHDRASQTKYEFAAQSWTADGSGSLFFR